MLIHKEMAAAFAKLANDTLPQLKGRNLDELREFIADKDLVVGVWNTEDTDNPIDCLIIKGEDQLRAIVHQDISMLTSVAAIPVDCAEEAEAFRQTIGDLANDGPTN